MTPAEFNDIVGEHLVDAWGDRHFPLIFNSKLWRIAGAISAGEFRGALENLNLTMQKAPTLAQIRTACWPAIQKATSERRAELLAKLAPCSHCSGGGWVIAYDPADPTMETAFICRQCTAATLRGLTESRGARVWSEEAARGLVPRLATRESSEAYAVAMSRYMDARRKPKSAALRDGLANAMASLGISAPK